MNTTSSDRPKYISFWRLPLFHFIILGILIFAWDAFRAKTPSQDSYEIVVTVPQVERMVGLWTKTWGRPPTDQELQGLVRDHIKEEIYYREARRLGLDQNDVVIRRRLRQKMEFLSADSVNDDEPETETLLSFYENNQDKYLKSAIFEFEQIYYKIDQKERAATDLLTARLARNTEGLGDSISLPAKLENADERKVSKTFGSIFWTNIQSIPENIWEGPIESGFGLHLVKINKKEGADVLPFETVRDKVKRDWQIASKQMTQETAFEALRSAYKIDIEMPAE